MFTTATKDSVRDTFENVKADVKDGANRASKDFRNVANNVRNDMSFNNLEGAAHQIGESVHEYVDNATRQINDISNQVGSQIRTNPVQATVVALAVGFLFGVLTRR